MTADWRRRHLSTSLFRPTGWNSPLPASCQSRQPVLASRQVPITPTAGKRPPPSVIAAIHAAAASSRARRFNMGMVSRWGLQSKACWLGTSWEGAVACVVAAAARRAQRRAEWAESKGAARALECEQRLFGAHPTCRSQQPARPGPTHLGHPPHLAPTRRLPARCPQR